MNEKFEPDEGDEASLAALLRQVGPRATAPEEMVRQVRAAVEAEWRATVARSPVQPSSRSFRRPAWTALAVAASLGAAALGLWLGLPLLQSPGAPVATVNRAIGTVEWSRSDAGRWQMAAPGQQLVASQDIQTGPGGRVALALADGASLRLDENTRVALLDADRLEVRRGAVYLDAGTSGHGADRLVIETRFGSTRHLGTQYEVRVEPGDMIVTVREGRVATMSPAGTIESTAGERLQVGVDGQVRRSVVAVRGPEWAWIGAVTPTYAIERRPLPDFLVWVARETGRELEFASPESRAEAAKVTLRGSVAGLSPDAALAAVLATTRLGSVTRDDRIVIDLQAADRPPGAR